MLILMKLPKKTAVGLGVGAAAGGALLAKSAGGLKAIGLALAGLFSHAGGEVAVAAPMLSRSATELTALGSALVPSARQVPAVSQVVVQALVRVPGHERDQLASLAGEQRDRFLVLIAQQDMKAQGLKGYLHGPFRDWGADTVQAFRRQGQPQVAEVLEEARRLTRSSDQWDGFEQKIRVLLN